MLPLESLFRGLNDGGGRYIVVGGLAVVLHGHLRATGDIDLVVDLSAAAVDRTLAALESAGFRPYLPVPASDFAKPATRAAWARDTGMLVFSLRPESGVPMVDLFLEHPLPFEELWARSLVVTLRGVPVRVASIDDLIVLKRRAGRPEDLADIEALVAIQRLRGGDR
jgi:predicted nucleotidyltransferase